MLTAKSSILRGQNAVPWALLWALPCFKCSCLLVPQNIWQQPCSAFLRKQTKGSPWKELIALHISINLDHATQMHVPVVCVVVCSSYHGSLGRGWLWVVCKLLEQGISFISCFQMTALLGEGSREWVSGLMRCSGRSSSSLRYMKWKEWLVN